MTKKAKVKSKGNGKYHYWLTKEGLLKLEGWAKDGLTNEQIAHNIGVTRKTLQEWMVKYSDISDTLKRGKEIVDREVENALLKKALGYKEILRKTKVLNDGELIPYLEEVSYPGDTTAQIFWLKNRKPNEWRDKRDIEHSGGISSEVNIVIGSEEYGD